VPLTVLWNKIDDLKDLAEHIHAPISEQQCINIALRKLINTQTFTEEIKKWKTLNQTSWAIFKQHFRQAQQDLRDLGGLQMQQTQIFQANLVNEVIEGVQALLDSHHVPPAEHQEQAPPDPAANAIIPPANPVIDQNLMQNFQMFMQLQNLMNPPRGGRGGRGNRGREGRGGRGDRPRIVHSYCLTTVKHTSESEHIFIHIFTREFPCVSYYHDLPSLYSSICVRHCSSSCCCSLCSL
jgi:hypothetical protein